MADHEILLKFERWWLDKDNSQMPSASPSTSQRGLIKNRVFESKMAVLSSEWTTNLPEKWTFILKKIKLKKRKISCISFNKMQSLGHCCVSVIRMPSLNPPIEAQ